jgi:hypothetical protein
VDFANDLVEAGGYLLGVTPANVAGYGEALNNQPLPLSFTPLHDLITIHYLHRRCSVVVAHLGLRRSIA